jgi:hypothetical protein
MPEFRRAQAGHIRLRGALLRRVLIAVTAALLALAAGASAAPPELSVSDRLDDRRYVASGTRGYLVGVESGDFPAMGWHTRGEMGGIWTPPLKLLDGVWFAIDGQWLPAASRFTSGQGYVRMDYPVTAGLRVSRREFVPDGRRAALIELSLRSTGGDRRVEVWVDAHSELMSIYPWGETNPSQLDFNGQDAASFDAGELTFTETGKPWTAMVSSDPPPAGGETGPGFRGPHANPIVCGPSGPGQPPPPQRCQDSAYGKGAGGRLRYELNVPAGRERRLLIAVAGSDRSPAEARRELGVALDGADASFRAKVESRRKLERYSQLSLPGDPLLAQGIDWSKQNLADSVQVAQGLQVREVHAGRDYPPPSGSVQHVRFVGAGWPDYPWLFATDGEYTAFASVAVGQFEPIMDHLRALRDVSRVANGDTGKVVHEVMTDGSVYFGANEDAGNTDETVKLPSAVALVWRWTGDDRFRDEMYDFAVDGMRWALSTLDADGDGWLEGPGNVEREGMGEEKLDVAVYTIRGLRDLADLARSRGDRATASWALERARDLERRFEAEWWMPEVPQHADSLADGNAKLQQRHWIGAIPMEAELVRGGRIVPGLTTFPHGEAALALRETGCYSGDFGLFHTGIPGCDPVAGGTGERKVFTLNTAMMAIGEGNYGRLGADQQGRYTTGNRRLQLPEADEQPGAMPEIAPSPEYVRSIDQPLVDRAMVLQAWGAYGTAWPVVRQQLGVRPDMGRDRLEVVPQVPDGQVSVAGSNIRLGLAGSADVRARDSGSRYVTVVRARVPLRRLVIGHTLPHGASVQGVRLDGERVRHRLRETNRGVEVLVRAPVRGEHKLVVRPR